MLCFELSKLDLCVFICLALSLDYMVHLSLGDSASSGESGLGWHKLFVFSFLGIGACFQLATHANWPLALVVSEQFAPVGASFT